MPFYSLQIQECHSDLRIESKSPAMPHRQIYDPDLADFPMSSVIPHHSFFLSPHSSPSALFWALGSMYVLFQLLQTPLLSSHRKKKKTWSPIHILYILKYSSIYWFIFSDYSNVTFHISLFFWRARNHDLKVQSNQCLLLVLRYLVIFVAGKIKVVIKSTESQHLWDFNANNPLRKLFHPSVPRFLHQEKTEVLSNSQVSMFGLNGLRHG